MQENCTGYREYGIQAIRFKLLPYRQQIRYRIITGNLLFTSMQGLDSQVILKL